MRTAALPVGAATPTVSSPCSCIMALTMQATLKVLPTPGEPCRQPYRCDVDISIAASWCPDSGLPGGACAAMASTAGHCNSPLSFAFPTAIAMSISCAAAGSQATYRRHSLTRNIPSCCASTSVSSGFARGPISPRSFAPICSAPCHVLPVVRVSTETESNMACSCRNGAAIASAIASGVSHCSRTRAQYSWSASLKPTPRN